MNKWLKETISIKRIGDLCVFQNTRARLTCNDGYSVSIQASEHTYCTPRYTQYQDGDIWHVINGNFFDYGEKPRNFTSENYIPYEAVELGFPSEADELINEYAEDDDYTDTVYGYVPVDIVEKLIEKHGGIMNEH